MLEDCQGNVRYSQRGLRDCSVWVVQPLRLVSQSHDVASLLKQRVSVSFASIGSKRLNTYHELDSNSGNMQTARPWDPTKRSCRTAVALCS
jgi:hypothetical protein